ncbi:cytochrome b [Caballeronia sp. LZ062]|uniref:cytochrome b n=1 Tax=unclassified Caballeronia TaxID=2646786 RepID=UPI0028572B76|nr:MULTISPECIES: cytochrome b [unclassified Caballeronia]MDR5857178.1 cytochrome b [Caballeronia sp. LZ050]MDR5869426.1 cytochrome b [Caballeronia sp. LZ062]
MTAVRIPAATHDATCVANDRFARPLVVLHWVIAVAIVVMLCIGLYMVGLPRGLPFKSTLINFHKSLGMTVFLLVLIRILVRLGYGRPPLPPMGAWQRAAASTTQALLYIGMIAMPLTGYLGSSFNRFGTRFWGAPLPQWGWDDKALRELFFGLHVYLAWIMAALIVLHTLGVAKHQFIEKDGLLRRMWP